MTYLKHADNFMASLNVEAYRVGGSVRDELLGRNPKDGDYVVRGKSLPILGAILRRAARKVDPKAAVTKLQLRTGQHSGWRVAIAGIGTLEVMLPRTDEKTFNTKSGNERHAFNISVDPDLPLSEDALRRDLTMNAIYKPIGNLAHSNLSNAQNVIQLDKCSYIDPLGGIIDLGFKVLRITHENSFRDDPLRILRAVRFQAQLGFALEGLTRLWMEKYAYAVHGLTEKGISGTATDEFFKILMGRHVGTALRTLRDTGVLAEFIPELSDMIGHDPQNNHHSFSTDEHTFVAIEAAAKLNLSLRVRLSLLFHDSGKPEVEWVGEDGMKHFYASVQRYNLNGEDAEFETEDHAVVSKRLFLSAGNRFNWPKDLMRDVPTLIIKHMVPLTMKIKPTKIRKWRVEIGDELLEDLFKHRLCDVIGKGTVNYEDLKAIARMEDIREAAVEAKIPTSTKDMKTLGLIDGSDLIAMGIEGTKIGEVLKELLHEVVSNPDRMNREWMLGRAEKLGAKK